MSENSEEDEQVFDDEGFSPITHCVKGWSKSKQGICNNKLCGKRTQRISKKIKMNLVESFSDFSKTESGMSVTVKFSSSNTSSLQQRESIRSEIDITGQG